MLKMLVLLLLGVLTTVYANELKYNFVGEYYDPTPLPKSVWEMFPNTNFFPPPPPAYLPKQIMRRQNLVLPQPSVTYAAYYNRNVQRYNDHNTGFYNFGSLIGGGGGHRSGGGGGHRFGGDGGHIFGGGGGHRFGGGSGHRFGGGGGHGNGGGGGHRYGGDGGHGYGGGGGHGYGVGGGHGYLTAPVSYGLGGGGHGVLSIGGSSGYGGNAGYREIYEHGVDNGHGGFGNRGFGGRIHVLRMRRTQLAHGKGAPVVREQVARKPSLY